MKNRKLLSVSILLIAVLLLVPSVYAQKTKIKVDGNIIKGYIEFMAADKHLGRKPLTPEFGVCLDWAAEKFKEWGLKPAGDNGTYFQAVPIEGRRAEFAWTKGVPKLKIVDREFFIKFEDFFVKALYYTHSNFHFREYLYAYTILKSSGGIITPQVIIELFDHFIELSQRYKAFPFWLVLNLSRKTQQVIFFEEWYLSFINSYTNMLKDFHPLSIKMAKEQTLPLNPSRISGSCGRIKCCMAYEYCVYREFAKDLPHMGEKVSTPEGRGRVKDINILNFSSKSICNSIFF